MAYAPLMFCKNSVEAGREFQKCFEEFYYRRKLGTLFPLDFERDSAEALIDYGFNKAFTFPSRFCSLTPIIDETGFQMFGGGVNHRREYADLFCCYALMFEWQKNKQVLTCDDDFVRALIQTENLKIPVDICDRLPFTTMCLDLQSNRVFKDYDYLYINLQCKGKWLYLTLLRVVDNEVFFILNDSFNETNIVKDSDGSEFYQFKKKNVKIEEKGLQVCKTAEFKNYDGRQIDNSDKQEVITFLWQLMLYLTASNKDMKENPTTKLTYKKPISKEAIKNKFSEVQQWDLGYVWGNTFRVNRRETVARTNIGERRELQNPRRSPRPHLRNAHWSHYWCGKGRTEYELRWIEPTYVNSTEDNPVILHEVR